jgi:bloom syndrome protein
MRDQVASLKLKGIRAEMLYEKSPAKDILEVGARTTSLCFKLTTQIKKQLRMGHPTLRLLYVTPETLFGAKLASDLDCAYKQKQIIRLVIDEVSRFSYVNAS